MYKCSYSWTLLDNHTHGIYVYTNWYIDYIIYFYCIAAFHKKIVMRLSLPVLVYKSKHHTVKQCWLKSTSRHALNGNKTYVISIFTSPRGGTGSVPPDITSSHAIWYTCKTHKTGTHHTRIHPHNTRAYTWTVSFTLNKVRILDKLMLNYYFELM